MDGLKQTFVQGVISRKQNKSTGSKFVNCKRRNAESTNLSSLPVAQEETPAIAEVAPIIPSISLPVPEIVVPKAGFASLEDVFAFMQSDEHLGNQNQAFSCSTFTCLNDVFRSLVADQPAFAKHVLSTSSFTSLCS
jgi:hypothetical protein